jgi:hypothetical protein
MDWWANGGNYMMLPTKALLLAKEIISKMHELGVAHGDFSHSVVDTLHGMEPFAQACKGDNEYLDEMVKT